MSGRRNLEDAYPLTPMQQLMLLHERSAVEASALASRFVYRISGELDVEAFERAWNRVVQRHSILRTAFVWDGLEQPLQAVGREGTVPLEQLDHRELTPEERELELESLLEAERRRRFDLRWPPLMRLWLIRTGETDWTLVWSNHHLILDRWCLDPLFGELRALYSGDDSLPDPAPYRRYVDWLDGQDARAAEEFWRASLRGFAEPSLASPGEAGRSTQGATERAERELAAGLCEKLRALAAGAGVSLGTVIQAAMALLLARETGRNDIAFGLTVSGRPPDLAGVESILGTFINNLPVRVRLRPDSPVREWLASLQAAQAKRAAFGHVSIAQIHQWSDLPLSRPLFDVLLLTGSPAAKLFDWPGVRIEAVGGGLDSAYAAMFLVDDGAQRLGVTFDPSRLEPSRAQALLDGLAQACGDLCVHAGGTLSALGSAESRARAEQRAPAAAPESTSTLDTVVAIWREALNRPEAGPDDEFFALGGSSLQAAQAYLAIEQRLGRRPPFSALLEGGTARDLAALLEEAGEHRPPLPAGLFELRSEGSRPPLFLAPPGDPAMLIDVTRELGPDQPVFGLEPKGLYDKQEPETDLDRIVEYFLDAVRPLAGEEFFLGGVCWGAAVAFEMASRLAAAGSPPAGLALIFPPAIGSDEPAATGMADAKAAFVHARLRLYWDAMREQRGADRWRYLRDKLGVAIRGALRGNAFERSEVEVRRIRLTEANRGALTGFDPRPYSGPTALFVKPPPYDQVWQETLAYWRRLTPADATWYEVPAPVSDHGLYPENSGPTARKLEEFVDRVRDRRPAPG